MRVVGGGLLLTRLIAYHFVAAGRECVQTHGTGGFGHRVEIAETPFYHGTDASATEVAVGLGFAPRCRSRSFAVEDALPGVVVEPSGARATQRGGVLHLDGGALVYAKETRGNLLLRLLILKTSKMAMFIELIDREDF